jgi:hypothetical protein
MFESIIHIQSAMSIVKLPLDQGGRMVGSVRQSWRWQGLLIFSCVAAGAVGGLLLARMLAGPDDAGGPAADPGAGVRVQSVLAQLLLREAGLSARQDPLALTAAEVNAFLAEHVQVRDAPVWPVRVRIGADGVELSGVTMLGRLVSAALGSWAEATLPGSIVGQPVWVAVRGQVEVDSGGRAEFRANSGVMGRQTIPMALLWWALGGRPSALAWRMPRVVERVESEPGRLVIHTRPRGAGRTSPGYPLGG